MDFLNGMDPVKFIIIQTILDGQIDFFYELACTVLSTSTSSVLITQI